MNRLNTFLAPIGAVILTGGSSGIGRRFIADVGKAKPGVRVCNLSRSDPGRFPERFTLLHIPCDLADPAQRAKAYSEVEKFVSEGGDRSPVLLINNAGIGSYGLFPTEGPGRDAALVAVNVAAVVELTARLLPHIRTRGGGIINVASTAAFQATPFAATYGATKAFLLNWSLALREELRSQGIPVVAVCPGPTRTAFFKSAGLDGTQADGAFGSDAGDVVRAAFAGLARNKGIVVPGIRNKILAAASGLVPRALAARVSGLVLGSVRKTGGPNP